MNMATNDSPSEAAAVAAPSRGSAKLLRFLIYNSDWGPREGQELEKIVFYHPAEDGDRARRQNVGFAEGCSNFAAVFTGPRGGGAPGQCRFVNTQKTKTALLPAGGGFHMALTVALPYGPARRRKKSSKSSGVPPEDALGGGDDEPAVEYAPENVHDGVLASALRHARDAFAFFANPDGFSGDGGSDEEDRESLRRQTSAFFSRFVPSTMARAVGGHHSLDDFYRPVQFLTLDSLDLLRVVEYPKK